MTSTPPITVSSDDFKPRTLLRSDTAQTWEDEVRQVSQDRMRLEPDDETGSRDFDFHESKVDDLNDCVQDESGRAKLAEYLPSKIVFEARNKLHDTIRQGLDDDGSETLEDALRLLENRLGRGSVLWEQNKVEILLDLGRYIEARTLLGALSFGTRAQELGQPVQMMAGRRRSSASRDIGMNYDQMPRSGKAEMWQHNLDLALRAGEWEQVSKARTELRRIDPSYFDIQKPMEGPTKIRQLLNLGYLAELDAQRTDDMRKKSKFLEGALQAYNYGRFASQVFDPPGSRSVNAHHVDVANLSISAARVCIAFCDLEVLFTPSRYGLAPEIAEPTWAQQALSFLDQGRSRALLKSIIEEEEYVPKKDKKLIDSVLDSVSFAASAAIGIRRRDSFMAGYTPPLSAISSPIDVRPNPAKQSLSSKGESPQSLPSFSPLQLTLENKRRATFHDEGKIDFSDSEPSSPSLRPSSSMQDPEFMSHVRIRMRWRRAYLYVLSKKYSEDSSAFSDVAAAIPDSSVKKFSELSRAIPEDAVVIEYGLPSSSPSGLVIVLATSKGVQEAQWLDISEKELRVRIRTLRRKMNAENKDYSESRREAASPASPRSARSARSVPDFEDNTVDELLYALYDCLISPIEAAVGVETVKQLIIVPSGELAHVPWGMLVSKPYQMVPSLAIWHRLHDHSTQANLITEPNISFFANRPKDPEGKLRNIPYSRIEALYLAQQHGQTPQLADDYQKATFKTFAKSLDILHLCAHSNYDDNDPLNSSVQLFNEPWAIKDWRELNISAQIVVFSSCLSAISQAFDSGSTFGFAHTLLATGTRAFVGSLWYVDDVATLLFMMLFYEELRRALSPAEALHNAKCRLKDIDEDGLSELVFLIQSMFEQMGSRAQDFVIAPDYWIRELREYDVENLRGPRCWAAFVLTGYGSRSVYPEGFEAV